MSELKVVQFPNAAPKISLPDGLRRLADELEKNKVEDTAMCVVAIQRVRGVIPQPSIIAMLAPEKVDMLQVLGYMGFARAEIERSLLSGAVDMGKR